ncbi:MAG: DNA replication/repair protein RecF [Mesorhizobium sp.]|nr:DNA replication/repair protein RecF [Mesorhizobium sp.]
MPAPDGGEAGRPSQVFVARLKIVNFRNYELADIALAPGLVVLTGENGAGKTNLLEAVSLLTPGRGLRRAAYADMPRQTGGGGFAIHATLDGSAGACEIGTGTSGPGPDAEGGRKVRINGAPAAADDLMQWLRVVWLTPAMDALFTGPAADRRRFLDRLVLAIDPAHGRRALDYEKAMRGRNRLLAEESRDTRWFEAIEVQMAETGVAIAAARDEVVRLMKRMIEKLPDDGPFPKADIAIDGLLESQFGDRAAVDIEEGFLRALADERGRDRAAGRTLSGPHRSDLLVRHRPKDMAAEFCSTGEQKALLIGMTLAHARLTAEISGLTPILLLDEIAAHLDEGRRAALFGILGELGGQTLMTGTDAALFSSVAGRAQFLAVAHGKVGSL